MQTFPSIFFAALFCMLTCSCKKNIASAHNQTLITDARTDAIKPFTVIGRQQVITLQTGDETYPLSQALLWVPDLIKKNPKNAKTRFPLIINLYGQGQNGTNLNLLLRDHTMSAYISSGFNASAVNPADGKTYSFFVCSPQCPISWGWSAPQVNEMLKQLKNRLPIDTTRIYITGFSSGGWGLWSCVTDNDELTKQFAAIIPISSAAADHPDKITNVDKYGIACLNVCGSQDAFYPNAVDYTNIINSNNPPIPAILNTLNNVDHSAWVYAYDNTWKGTNGLNIYEWMLQYKRH